MKTWQLVLASDGSEGALRAARWLTERFSPEEAELTILTVAHTPTVVGSPNFASMPAYGMAMEDAADSEAHQAAQKTLAMLQSWHPRASIITGSSVVPAIVAYLNDHPVDALVIGRRGHAAVRNLLVGSVSSGLVNQSPIPVWLIP